MADVHPTAIVAAGARLGAGVRIGPYCVVDGEVELEDGVVLEAHVAVTGNTRIGVRTRVHPFAAIGAAPQDLSYKDEASRVRIGADTTIREHVTIHRGTAKGRLLTEVGNHCYLMVASHVGHDCQVRDHSILSNNVMLGGHSSVGEHVILGGGAAVLQQVRIGDHAFIGGVTGVGKDVIPFGYVFGNRGRLSGINLIGLKRRGFARQQVRTLLRTYRVLFGHEGTFQSRFDRALELYGDEPLVQRVAEFIHDGGDRPLLTPMEGRGD